MSLSSFRFPFVFDSDRLRRDAMEFRPDEWVPHFNRHYYQGDWSVVPLRAVKGGIAAIYPDPNAPLGYEYTPQFARCGYVGDVLGSFECELQTARFLKLGAGSEIKRHRDYELGPEDGFVRVHIPVQTNDAVLFTLDDVGIPMKVGEAWFLNVNKYHSVTNAGETDRIHLVIDCVMNDWLRSYIDA